MGVKTNLILLGFVSLFLELALIRWFPAHVFSVGFFTNVVLIGSFLGLGTGFLLASHRKSLERFFPFLFVLTLTLTLLIDDLKVAVPQNAQTWIWSFYGGNRHEVLTRFKELLPVEVSIPQVLSLVYVISMLVFIPLGQRIGRLISKLPPLEGYAWNVAGSLFGVFVFGILSTLGTPAFVWFAVTAVVYLTVTWRERWALLGAMAMLSSVAGVAVVERDITWSPYYAISTEVGKLSNRFIFVNKLFHQEVVNFAVNPDLYDKYSFPYRWFHPDKVLVIGAGSGNDVAIALRHGATRVDAVEIDPAILDIGIKHHPQNPYADAKVRVYVNDARSFMHNARDRYDMVVFGTLDSHANLSFTSSVRLDNYIYTREALREALGLLSDQGVVVLLFSVPHEGILSRLLATARTAFGEGNGYYCLYKGDLFNLIVVGGPGSATLAASSLPFKRAFSSISENPGEIVPTDDWPYLYLEHKGIPNLYLTVIAILVSISLCTILTASPLRHGNFDPLFFLFGCGFLLLETKSVTTLSLLFGSTWVVNAVVFLAILAIATFANLLVLWKGRINLQCLFAGLLISIAALYFLPVSSLLQLPEGPRIALAGSLVALPIFFSSMIFALVVRDVPNISLALGSNLLGAVVGGFCEYLSLIWGLNALYIMAFLVYGSAYAWSRKRYGSRVILPI